MDNFIPIDVTPEYETKAQRFTALMQTPEMINYTANKMHEQMMDNLTKSFLDIPFKNPNEKTESLLEEQLKQYESTNKELHKQLEDAQLQLKQLNDKESSQNLYIKELKADLRTESLKRELAESKLSSKDWKTALTAGVIGLITGLICAWVGSIL